MNVFGKFLFHNKVVSLNAGQPEKAASAGQEAVRIYRQLAEKLPDAFLPELARSLTVLGTLGRSRM